MQFIKMMLQRVTTNTILTA